MVMPRKIPVKENAEPFKLDGVYCRLIPLTRGMYAIVDADDYDWLMQWPWSALYRDPNGWCATRYVSSNKRVQRRRFMHTELMCGDGPVQVVDHRDGCELNNTRRNMRFATAQQNAANRRGTARSGFKGAYETPNGWTSYITHNYRQIYLGSFSTKEDAARAYDKKAVELFGLFARLNFPLSTAGGA